VIGDILPSILGLGVFIRKLFESEAELTVTFQSLTAKDAKSAKGKRIYHDDTANTTKEK
jgi:hypothetical protein